MQVEVSDVNDEAPRFSVAEWFLDVREGHPPGLPIASLSVIDPDTFNDFAFRVSENLTPNTNLGGLPLSLLACLCALRGGWV